MNCSYSRRDFELAEKFTAVVLGMDRYYQALDMDTSGEVSFSKEGIVPVNLTEVEPDNIKSWDEALKKLDEVYFGYLHEGNENRRVYMLQQIDSVIKLANWLSGKKMHYRQLVRELLYVNENPVPLEVMNALIAKLDTMLGEKGYEGTVEQKLKKWRKDRGVDKDKVEEVSDNLLCEAKKRTLELGFKEVADQDVKTVMVHNVPYQAYCDFKAGKVYINGDISHTYDSLKHLAIHEAFPGHATHLAVRQSLIREKAVPADAGLVITNTASSPIFEGIGDNGGKFLNWIDTEDDKINDLFQKISSITAMNSAHMINGEKRDRPEVIKYMKQFTFAEDEWVESRLRFIAHPFRSPFIYSYWRGNEAVGNVWSLVPETSRKDFIKYLYYNMQSIDSLKYFLNTCNGGNFQ